jgi:YgiT-type zinc finger domain-containing protein
MKSFDCHVCGGSAGRDSFVEEVFTIEGRHVLVKKIPARVCARCGEPVFSAETTERIRRLVHETAPSTTVPLDVFAMA